MEAIKSETSLLTCNVSAIFTECSLIKRDKGEKKESHSSARFFLLVHTLKIPKISSVTVLPFSLAQFHLLNKIQLIIMQFKEICS